MWVSYRTCANYTLRKFAQMQSNQQLISIFNPKRFAHTLLPAVAQPTIGRHPTCRYNIADSRVTVVLNRRLCVRWPGGCSLLCVLVRVSASRKQACDVQPIYDNEVSYTGYTGGGFMTVEDKRGPNCKSICLVVVWLGPY